VGQFAGLACGQRAVALQPGRFLVPAEQGRRRDQQLDGRGPTRPPTPTGGVPVGFTVGGGGVPVRGVGVSGGGVSGGGGVPVGGGGVSGGGVVGGGGGGEEVVGEQVGAGLSRVRGSFGGRPVAAWVRRW
jgi:hypothetical protein